MSVNVSAFENIKRKLSAYNAELVAVSKTKPSEDILELHQRGQRDFGENYVQELVEKHEALPKDIRWHFIGHLQRNKAKYIVPFVHLIHGVDSLKLLKEINKQAVKAKREVNCLLQVHIAREETKFGFDEKELFEAIPLLKDFPMVNVQGLMGMATFTEDTDSVKLEFKMLKGLLDNCNESGHLEEEWNLLSMGMSADYEIALEEGSTMVRIGSLLFGERENLISGQ